MSDWHQVFFDTEFIEDGRTIELLSIGMVRDDGRTLLCGGRGNRSWARVGVGAGQRVAESDRSGEAAGARSRRRSSRSSARGRCSGRITPITTGWRCASCTGR